MEQVVLSNGVKMPMIGFGCYKVSGDGEAVFRQAIEAGYRHFDTAKFYGNEKELGEAIKNSGIPREEFFITTKLWRDELERPQEAIEESLRLLNTDYLDLYLIHWPRPSDLSERWQELDLSAWRAMEEAYTDGRLRAIGVSNFLPHHLMPLFDRAEVRPMVNQLEFHPGYTQEAAVAYSKENGMVVEAWSPLGRTRLGKEPLLLKLAEKYQTTTAAVCLRFALQCGIVPLPKTSDPGRMKENLDIFGFSLEESDMYRIRTLPQAGWSGEHPDRETAEKDMRFS